MDAKLMADAVEAPEAVILSSDLVEEDGIRRERRQLNLAAMATAGFTVLILLLSMIWDLSLIHISEPTRHLSIG